MSSGSVALQLFWELSSADGARRHAAALQLTKALRLAHKTAEAAGDLPAAGDDQKAGALRSDGGALSVEVTYAVRRLVKGLASSREGSREGFVLGLCLLLRSFPEIDGERLLVMMIDSLPIKGGGMSDTEIKENNFGRLFGCMALIQTGKCSPSASEWTAAANSGAIDAMLCVKVLDELARLQGCKSFMAEATTHAVGQMMSIALSDAPVDVVANQLLPRLRKGGEELDVREMTPEQLEMHLFAQGLLAQGNAPCLKETRMGELVEPLKKATASHPRLHHVWTQLLGLIAGFQGDKAKAGSTAKWGAESVKMLGNFWTTVVEESLLVSSHERKYAALLLVQELACDVPAAGLLAVLTPNLRRTIINNVGKKQCLLNSVANKTLEALMARAAEDADLAFDLLELIITQHRNFDKVTHTRTTTRLLELLDAKGKMRYLKLLLNAYCEAAEAAEAADAPGEESKHGDDEEGGLLASSSSSVGRQRWALESIYSLVTRQRASVGPVVQEALLGWLMQTAFFKRPAAAQSKVAKGSKGAKAASRAAPPPPPAEIQEVCLARFFSLLEALSTRGAAAESSARPAQALPPDVLQALARFSPMYEEVASKAAALTGDVAAVDAADVQLYWPLRAHLTWKALEALGVDKLVKWEKSLVQVRQDSWKVTRDLMSSAVGAGAEQGGVALRKRESRALALLMLYNGLELLSDAPSAVNVVVELQQCHERVLALRARQAKGPAGAASGSKRGTKTSKRQMEDDGGEEASEDEVMSVLVEVLVSLLARPSAVLRNVVKSTFRAFCDSMTASTIEVLIQVLSGSSADLFDDDGDDDGDDDMDDGESDGASDDGGDESEDDGDDVAEQEQVAKALDQPRKAPKVPKQPGDKRKSADMDEEDEEDDDSEEEDEDEEEDWDDDKMFEIDHLVGAAFKSRLQEAKLAKQTSSMSLVLKLRTLELVEVFLSRKEPSALALVLVEPLLDLAISGGSGDKKMGESAQQRVSFHAKVSSLYADKLCRLRPAPCVASAAQAREVVGMVERLCQRMVSHGELASAGLSFLLRVLAASASKHASALDSALAHVAALLERWASKKHSNIKPIFFTQLFERQPAVAWALAPKAVAHAQAGASDFHTTACFEMLLALVRQTGVLKGEAALAQVGHARKALQGVPAALEAAVTQAEADATSKKVTKMLQAGLALALKCLDLEQEYKLGLDEAKLASVAAQIEASTTAARAKSVQQAAARLKQRTAAKSAPPPRDKARGKPAAVQAAAGASKATTPAGKKLKTVPR